METSSRLLSIPVELREKILVHLLHSPKPIQCSYVTGYTWRNQVYPAVLETCHQLLNEGGHILYQRNTVLTQSGTEDLPWALYRIRSWVITVRTDETWHYCNEEYVKFLKTVSTLRERTPNLRMVKVLIYDRTPNHLIVMRVTHVVKMEGGSLVNLPECIRWHDKISCPIHQHIYNPGESIPYTKLDHIIELARQTEFLHPLDGVWLEIDHFADTKSTFNLPRKCLAGRCDCIDKHFHRS